MKYIALFITLLTLAGTASTAVLEVPTQHSTIQAAVDAAGEGDTVLLLRYTYHENVVISEKNIVLCSDYYLTGDSSMFGGVTINGDSAGPVITITGGQDTSTVIFGLTITNGGEDDPFYGGGISCREASPLIEHNVIRNNVGYLGGGIHCFKSQAVIRNNDIRENRSYHDFGTWQGWTRGGGIYADSSALTLAGNVIRGNRGSEGGGVSFLHSEVDMMENLVYRCTCAVAAGIFAESSIVNIDRATVSQNYWYVAEFGAGGGLILRDAEVSVSNSILWGDRSPEVWVVSGAAPTIQFSDVEGGYTGEGNVEINPVFCQPENQDFYLSPESPCLSAGSGACRIGALDIGCTDCCFGLTGDINQDPMGYSDVSDLILLVNHLFVTHQSLPCPGEANITGDPNCEIDISDLTAMVDFLFGSFRPPAHCDAACWQP
jgi:hypothetical protein